VLVGVAGMVFGAEFVVAGTAVSQQVPHNDEYGPGDGDEGLELAAPPDQAPVPLAEEGVGAGGRGGGKARDALEVRVAT
jgi:hypothetical protein